MLPVFYSAYNWNYLRNKIDRLYIDQSWVHTLLENLFYSNSIVEFLYSCSENLCKRFGFADKIISQRESRALNLMSICFLLTYVISYWPLLAFHVLRCFEYAGLSAQKCESIRRIVETLPWFQPVVNPLIFIFFGTICGPIPTQCTLCKSYLLSY